MKPEQLKTLNDDLAERILRFFSADKFIPSRELGKDDQFGGWEVRLVQARAQILRRAGFLEKRGERSGTIYRLTEKGLRQRERLSGNGSAK